MEEFKKALFEGAKELARVIVLAIIPVAVASLQEKGKVDWDLVVVAGGIALLRFVDKVMHEWGKELDNQALIKGITQF